MSNTASADNSKTNPSPPSISSAQLFQGANRLVINHSGENYCLRITRNEKLILTKN